MQVLSSANSKSRINPNTLKTSRLHHTENRTFATTKTRKRRAGMKVAEDDGTKGKMNLHRIEWIKENPGGLERDFKQTYWSQLTPEQKKGPYVSSQITEFLLGFYIYEIGLPQDYAFELLYNRALDRSEGAGVGCERSGR
ncbi:hypothetical protein MPER_11616, partial [Moniliophthora perniciosa FA553]